MVGCACFLAPFSYCSFSCLFFPGAAIIDPFTQDIQTYEYARNLQQNLWKDVPASFFNNNENEEEDDDDSSDEEEVKKTK